LAESVAKAMMKFLRSIDYPITLKEANVTPNHIKKMIKAANNPQLEMKLNNMPIPMSVRAGDIDRFMKPTLEASYKGDFALVPSL
jgi:alcohol dehydrogenase